MELSRGDANRIHLPLYNYLWIFGYKWTLCFLLHNLLEFAETELTIKKINETFQRCGSA